MMTLSLVVWLIWVSVLPMQQTLLGQQSWKTYARADICLTTEKFMLTADRARYGDVVTVVWRLENKEAELFASIIGVRHAIDVVVIYTTIRSELYKVGMYLDGCLSTGGYISREVYEKALGLMSLWK